MSRADAVGLIGVYRRRNAEHVRPLVGAASRAGWTSAWWALDEQDDALASHTVGVGPGLRLALLNETLARSGLQGGWLIVSDDDLEFTRGDLVALVSVCERGKLDLAQPARSDDNSTHEFNVAHRITRARRLSKARTTTFVEIGPLFVVGPRWRDRIVPFPEARGMGWGLELDWHRLYQAGCRLGIVDSVRVAHLGAPGADYEFEGEAERVHRELAERGFAGWEDVQRTPATWRPWRREPPWVVEES